MSNYIEMRGINKSFGKVHAVKNASFELNKGEIHSVIGENGAGKSTLMKLLYGMFPLDSGIISIKGQDLTELSTKEAIELGIGMVHQEFMLVDDLTVLENIILGFEPEKKGGLIDFDKARQNIQEYIDKYGIVVPMDKKINQISVGEAQRVEIIKVLSRGADVIILDEPTGVLTPQEASQLFVILESLKQLGKSVVFISHKLNEVMEISDRITVMRRGEILETVNKVDTNERLLSKAMVGREVFLDIERKKTEIGEPVLEVIDLWTSGEKELSKIRGVSFDVKAGEVLGIAGVDGNGQSELIEALTGLREVEKGIVKVDGQDITNKSPGKIRNSGLSHIPEDRNITGLNRAGSMIDNIVVTDVNNGLYLKYGFILDKDKMKEDTETLIKQYDVRPTDPETITQNMSGGNAQKIVVAREVTGVDKILIAAQPTRGIDIGAIELIRKLIQDVKATGVGVLLISTELEEILSLSDRIAVLSEGNIVGTLDVEDANEENLGLLMLSGRSTQGMGYKGGTEL